MDNRILIRVFPWILAAIIVGGMYFILQSKMEEDLEKAKLSIRQKNVEELIMGLGELEMMHYNFKDVLFYESLDPYIDKSYDIDGKEPVVLVQGTAFAGIDFTKVEKEDFQFDNDSTLNLVVPYPSMFSYTISDEITVITDENISEDEIRKALAKMKKQHDSMAFQPLDLMIDEEHILLILEPVLEKMTNERIAIKFVRKN